MRLATTKKLLLATASALAALGSATAYGNFILGGSTSSNVSPHKLREDGFFVTPFIQTQGLVVSISQDMSGNVLLLYSDGSISRYTTSGTLLPGISTGISGVTSVTVDPSNNIYVSSSSNNIYKFDSAGVSQGIFLNSSNGLINVRGMTFDQGGNLWVINNVTSSSTNALLQYDGNGATIKSVKSSQLVLANSLAVEAATGNVYVTTAGPVTAQRTVRKVTFSGNVGTVTTFLSNQGGPRALAFDSKGNLLLGSDISPGGVKIFALPGTTPINSIGSNIGCIYDVEEPYTATGAGAWSSDTTWTVGSTLVRQHNCFPVTFAGTSNYSSNNDLTSDSQNLNAGMVFSNTGTTSLTGNSFKLGKGKVDMQAGAGNVLINNNITLTGNATFGNASTTASLTLSGAVTGTGTFTKQGNGNLIVAGSLSLAGGATTVQAGRLSVNGSLTASPVTVTTGGKLGGTGVVTGDITIASGGTIEPGNSIGTFNSGSVSLTAADSSFAAEIDALTPAADLLNVTGSVSLSGSTLNLSVANIASITGPTTFELVDNDSTDAIAGTFGTILGVPAGYTATIDYAFTGTDALGRVGTGNDIAVTISVPEPASLGVTVLSLGMLLGKRKSKSTK